MSPLKREFFPYHALEEHTAGMWRRVSPADAEGYIEAAAALMRDPEAFELAMRLALSGWPNSVRAAMTTGSLNRRAWFGHAGCCVATGSPEHLTRLGWHRLNADEQDAANAAADRVIDAWGLSTGLRLEDELWLFDA